MRVWQSNESSGLTPARAGASVFARRRLQRVVRHPPLSTGSRLIVDDRDLSARSKPLLEESTYQLRLAVKQTHANSEDLIEPSNTSVERKDIGDMELRLPRRDMLLVTSDGCFDHFRRFVDRDEMPRAQSVAHEACGNTMAAADLENVIIWMDSHSFDNVSQAFTHDHL